MYTLQNTIKQRQFTASIGHKLVCVEYTDLDDDVIDYSLEDMDSGCVLIDQTSMSEDPGNYDEDLFHTLESLAIHRYIRIEKDGTNILVIAGGVPYLKITQSTEG